MTFYDPNQPLNGTLANTASIRVGSPSPMYTDFSMRGVNMNASHYYINGIPNMFNQTRSIPAYVLSSVDIVSGPNTVLNGATFSNNGTNGTDAPAGLLNGTTKRATTDPVTRYTQRFSGRSTWTEDLDIGRRFGKTMNGASESTPTMKMADFLWKVPTYVIKVSTSIWTIRMKKAPLIFSAATMTGRSTAASAG